MACSCNSQYAKSAVRTYNNSAQTVVSSGTQLNLLGSSCTNSGCSLTAGNNAVTVNNKGLYYISADVTFTAGAAGVAIAQLYNGTTALPCAISQMTVAADGVTTMHVETVLCLTPCCNAIPALNVQVSGVAGTVNWVGMTVIKEA